MKRLLCLVGLLIGGVAHADKFPSSGPCENIDACEKACKAGKKGTCYWGGVLIIQAGTEPEDEARALALFDKACSKGEPDGCWQSANLVWYKESRDKGDGSTGRAAFQKACNKNHARACMRLADIAAAAEGDTKSQKLAATSRAKGVKLLEAKCSAKMARACAWVAELYESGLDGVKLDAKKAAAFRDKKCMIDTGKKCPLTAPTLAPQPPPAPEMTKPATKAVPAPTKAAPNKAATP